MQVIILAAGRGSRMGSLTSTTPKPLLEVSGQPLLVHTLSVLPRATTKVTIVVNYLGEMIKDLVGDKYTDIPVEYCFQKKLTGTGGALWQAKPLITESKFMVIGGDDWFENGDLEKCVKHDLAFGFAPSLTQVAYSPQIFDGLFCGFDEVGYNLATGVYVLDERIFDCIPERLASGFEFGLPQTVV